MNLLDYFLAAYNSEQLNGFVKLCTSALHLKERPTRKEDRARFIVNVLLDPQSIRTLWAQMDELSHKAIAAAYHNEGEFVADAFVAQYGSLPQRPKKSQWSYHTEMILLDLFFQQGRLLPQLMPLLKDLVPPPERFQVQGVAELQVRLDDNPNYPVELRVAETEKAGWHDLLLLLQMFDQRVLALKPDTGKLTPDSFSMLRKQLLQGDFLNPDDLETDWGDAGGPGRKKRADGKPKIEDTIRPYGLLTFARGAGLISTAGTGSLTDAGRALLTEQNPELLLDAFEKWEKESTVDEITRIDAIKGFKASGLRLTAPGMRRERIVEALSWCPAGVWIEISDFYRALKVWRFDFQVEQGGIEKLYIGYRYASSGYYDAWADDADMWRLVNGLYINAVLWEYLATIGALDLAYLPPGEADIEAAPYYGHDGPYFSRYDGLFYFRINPLGAYLFGQAGDYQAAKVGMAPLLEIDAERVVKVLDPARLTPMLIAQLEQVGAPVGDGAYRLDQQKLLLALEQGSDLDGVREFLLRNSGDSMPLAVARWLDEVKEASRAFTRAGAMLSVRAASPELVQLVLADAELSKFCTALGNRTVVLPANREARLRSRLRELGYGLRGK